MNQAEIKPREQYFERLTNLSTLDGREASFTGKLREYLSEGALHRNRGVVQVEVLIALSESDFPNRPEITDEEKERMRGLVTPEAFSSEAVAEYDHFGRNGIGPLEHDVKAVEMYLRERFDQSDLSHLKEWIHFPMTSEDLNNISWNLMLRDAMNHVWIPRLTSVMDKLASFSTTYAEAPVLGKTHGMDASPTTMGKRFSYTLEQFATIVDGMKDLKLTAKFSGPVGNHNAVTVAVPDFNFEGFAKQFVESFGFEYSANANQRNSHLAVAELLNKINLVNYFAADLCENVRHNVMMGWLYQKGEESHVGSSVMPHKINPWFFEVAQGTLEKSSALINGATPELLQSVFERDLTDHPWERAYGEMLGFSQVGLEYIDQGLDTLHVNNEFALKELQTTPQILAEAVQIVGRIAGVEDIYMKIIALSKGRALTQETLIQIIEEYIPDSDMKERLLALKPESYIGKAPQIARDTVERYIRVRQAIERGILDPVNQVRAFLFDFDNTLQVGDKDELNARLGAISEILEMGFTEEEIAEFGNRSDYREMRRLMVEEFSRKTGKCITEDQFQEVNNQVSGNYDDRFKLAEGTIEFLEYLRERGYKIGLVTTRGSNSLPRLLSMHGIEDYFDVVINRDDCERRKPHPQPIITALEKIGVTPDQAVYLGDKQVDDVIAGNSIGMQTVLVNPNPLDPYCSQPDYHVSNPHEALGIFYRRQ